MFSRVPGRKPNHIRIVVIAVLLLVLGVIALPAGATPPEDLTFETNLAFQLGNYTATGSWSAYDLLDASGVVIKYDQHAGYNDIGWFIRNIHSTVTLCSGVVDSCDGAEDTITIRAHIDNIDLVPFGPASGSGTWTIIDTTGAYEGLHGKGTATFVGDFYPDCPVETVAGPCLTDHTIYEGSGHFD